MATTLSFGTCPQCGKNNPSSVSECRYCKARLPWAKSPAVTRTKVPVAQRVAEISFEPLIFWLVGLLLFGVAFSLPMLGYWLYRYFSNEESDLSRFVGAGALCGIVLWALGFVAIMAKVGNTPSP